MKILAKITLKSVVLEKNNHVGQKGDWTYSAVVNSISLGKDIETNIDVTSGTVNFDLKVKEKDKVPDVGILKISLKYDNIKNTEQKLIVKVTENRGPYSGNTAEIAFTFLIK